MGNSFHFTKIVVIIIVILVLITMGMIIVNKAQIFTKEADKKISTDYNEFNTKWEVYGGTRQGSNVKTFISALINNAKENENDPTKLVDIMYQATEGGEIVTVYSKAGGEANNNIAGFEEAKKQMRSKHAYTIEFIYQEKTGLITGAVIKYNEKDEMTFKPDEN